MRPTPPVAAWDRHGVPVDPSPENASRVVRARYPCGAARFFVDLSPTPRDLGLVDRDTDDPDAAEHVMLDRPSDLSVVVSGRRGLEIGGPSPDLVPAHVYYAASVDNVTFSHATLWRTRPPGDGHAFAVNGEVLGREFTGDAVDLPFPDGSYDFIVASHVLEHLVNPLRAAHEMARVLRPGGRAIVVLPWKHATFDRRRPYTPFEVIRRKYDARRDESDVSDVLDEVARYYDVGLDPGVATMDQLLARSADHASNRALHVHVFDADAACRMLDAAGLRVDHHELARPYHAVFVATKSS